MLSNRQRAFVEFYARSRNATQSAIRAGYSQKTAYSQGQRLLKHPEVSRLITSLFGESFARAGEVLEPQAAPILLRTKHLSGFVYFMREPFGLVKIGKARNPNTRLKDIQTSSPYELRIEGVIQCENMHGLEAEIHTAFEHRLVRGEWYCLTTDEVMEILSRYGGKTYT